MQMVSLFFTQKQQNVNFYTKCIIAQICMGRFLNPHNILKCFLTFFHFGGNWRKKDNIPLTLLVFTCRSTLTYVVRIHLYLSSPKIAGELATFGIFFKIYFFSTWPFQTDWFLPINLHWGLAFLFWTWYGPHYLAHHCKESDLLQVILSNQI